MNYSSEIIIDVPLQKVIELFDSEENMFKWQPELVSLKLLQNKISKLPDPNKVSHHVLFYPGSRIKFDS